MFVCVNVPVCVHVHAFIHLCLSLHDSMHARLNHFVCVQVRLNQYILYCMYNKANLMQRTSLLGLYITVCMLCMVS